MKQKYFKHLKSYPIYHTSQDEEVLENIDEVIRDTTKDYLDVTFQSGKSTCISFDDFDCFLETGYTKYSRPDSHSSSVETIKDIS